MYCAETLVTNADRPTIQNELVKVPLSPFGEKKNGRSATIVYMER